jgi:hypothetical protein
MLRVTIPGTESFDEEKSEFVTAEAVVLELEHSLFSLSKWEQKWEKAFLGFEERTREETLDYVRMMILGAPPSEKDFSRLSAANLKEIIDYIDAKMSATVINQGRSGGPHEIVTAEIIYFWMINHGIWLECEHWHLNRLLTLIQVCNIKNSPKKQKMSGKQAAAERRALNDMRRKQYGTSG